MELLLLLPIFTIAFASRPVSFPGALQLQHEGEKMDLTNLKLAPLGKSSCGREDLNGECCRAQSS